MIATNKLRYVERYGNEVDKDVMPTATPLYVLQQWWEAEDSDPPLHGFPAEGQWRDVPVERER